MPKTLIFVLFLSLIFAPGGQILASGGSPASQATIYPSQWSIMAIFKVGVAQAFNVIKTTLKNISETKIIVNVKIFAIQIIEALGELINFVSSLIMKFYRFLYGNG